MKNPTAVLAEDETGIRQMLAFLLSHEKVQVIGEAGDGVEALRQCRKLKPTFLLTDLRLPLVDAASMQARLRGEEMHIPVMIYTGCETDSVLAHALHASPAVIVHKTDDLDDFRRGVRAAVEGSTFYSHRISRLRALRPRDPGSDGLQGLTDVQIEMLKLIASSKRTKEVADILGLSEKAADNQRSSLMTKLGLHDTAALTRFAMRHGLVEEE
jgi:DNA-binding NarL/FixJ family response regulator